MREEGRKNESSVVVVVIDNNIIHHRNIQPFFLLHKGSPRNFARRSVSRSKPITRRRINLTHLSPNSSEISEAPDQDNVDDHLDNHFKLDIFHNGWSKIDYAIRALIGDPRRAVQVDLLEFHKVLKCNCCSKSDHFPSPYMHDTSIMYILAQEHGDLINLHDWYQSFKTTILQSRTKAKNRLKHSPSPKKRKTVKDSPKKSEAAIQAEFCRAVTELQITGLLRMPSKRRPDYVQRVAFGI